MAHDQGLEGIERFVQGPGHGPQEYDPEIGIVEGKVIVTENRAENPACVSLCSPHHWPFLPVEFFRLRAVINTLSQPQKTQLVGSLAVLLRSDAQRYGEEKLKDFYEKDALERRLHGIEAILVTVVGGGNGGRIRAEIEAAGHEQRAQILKEAYKWVGDAAAQTSGALNAAPWNVPIGAP